MAIFYRYHFENTIKNDPKHPMYNELKDNDSIVIYAESEVDARRQLKDHIQMSERTKLLERNPW